MAKATKIHAADIQAMADRLRALRLVTGKTQAEFAAAYGFTQTQWANFEAGAGRISIDAALALKDNFLVPLDWIYTGETAWLPSGLKEAMAQVEPRPIRRSNAAQRSD